MEHNSPINPPLQPLLLATANALRCGEMAQAHAQLGEIMTILLAASERGEIVAVDRLVPLLNQILNAQQRRDPLLLADLLQYQLIPLITTP
jgi:hypothetical protein